MEKQTSDGFSKKNICDESLFEGHAEVTTEHKRRSPVTTGRADAVREKSARADVFLNELSSLYPAFIFIQSNRFKFRPPNRIYTAGPCDNFALLTLHELGHALCKHKDYNTHAERLKIECAAWERARAVLNEHPEWVKKYNIIYDEDFVEDQLDTYRDWLHQKSTCKTCGLTRFQTPDGHYHCPHCNLLLHASTP